MRTRLAVLSAVAAGCLLASALAASTSASGERSRSTSCRYVLGAKWVMPNGGSISGRRYSVGGVNGIGCTRARTYVSKLSYVKLAGKKVGHNYPLAGGPRGYTCTAVPDANGRAFGGECRIGPRAAAHPKHVFSWSPHA